MNQQQNIGVEKLFSIKDEKSDLFSMPFTSRTRGTAIRIFEQTVNNNQEGNLLSKYPQDYTLYQIADFDTLTGQILSNIEKIMRADEVAK